VKAAHKLIWETAKALAGATYENLMGSSNKVYKEMCRRTPSMTPKQREAEFVRLNAPLHLEAARATLAQMLSGPLDSHIKDEIHLALTLDAQLQRMRKKPRWMI